MNNSHPAIAVGATVRAVYENVPAAAGQPGEHLQLAMRLQCVAGLPHLWPSLLGGITIMTHSVSLHHCLPTQSENFLELNHAQDYAIPPP